MRSLEKESIKKKIIDAESQRNKQQLVIQIPN